MLLVSLTRLVDELTMRVLIGEGDADSSGAPTPSLIELNFCIDRVHPSCNNNLGDFLTLAGRKTGTSGNKLHINYKW